MIRALALPTALIALWGCSAAAQVSCGDRGIMAATLFNQYREVQMGLGLMRWNSRLIEVWGNCDSGTLTILETPANGTACVIALGQGWQGVGCEEGQPTKSRG